MLNVCRTADFQTFEKLCESNHFLNRKRNKRWLTAYSCDLFMWQYIGPDASMIDYITFPAMKVKGDHRSKFSDLKNRPRSQCEAS